MGIISADGFTWEFTDKLLTGRARANRNIHYTAKYVYIFFTDGKKHILWHRITTLPNATSLLQTIVTLKYSQKVVWLDLFLLFKYEQNIFFLY